MTTQQITPTPAATHSIPLRLMQSHECGVLVKLKVRDKETARHLQALGLVEGIILEVITNTSGDIVISFCGTSLALDRNITKRIFVSPLDNTKCADCPRKS